MLYEPSMLLITANEHVPCLGQEFYLVSLVVQPSPLSGNVGWFVSTHFLGRWHSAVLPCILVDTAFPFSVELTI